MNWGGFKGKYAVVCSNLECGKAASKNIVCIVLFLRLSFIAETSTKNKTQNRKS